MKDVDSPERPDFFSDMDANAFDNWYWSKSQLQDACRQLGLPLSGARDRLRSRVLAALKGEAAPVEPPRPLKSQTVWSKALLTEETIITSDISFGPNVRRWFSEQIGHNFVCHGDFMAWVKDHPGSTLRDAVLAWHELEARKLDPDFRRDIAPCNTYLQYLRDFRDEYPHEPLETGRRSWAARKLRPAPGGQIRFDRLDLERL